MELICGFLTMPEAGGTTLCSTLRSRSDGLKIGVLTITLIALVRLPSGMPIAAPRMPLESFLAFWTTERLGSGVQRLLDGF